MGRAKEWQLEQYERGYDEAEGDICAACVNEPALKAWVTDNAGAHACTFCGNEADEPIAASFDEFIGAVLAGVRFDWNHPDDEGIVYESAEGGYQASLTDTWDVLQDYNVSEDSDVIGAIVDAVGNDGWIERDFYAGDKSQRLEWGWDRFKHVVKHETRYVFLAPGDDELGAEVPPSRMLTAIGETIKDELADLALIKEIPTDADLIRIRVDDQAFHSASALGTPPVEFARQANRMSPAGIAMFYGAFDAATAKAETVDADADASKILSIATFRATRALRVLDVVDLPDIPSVFEEDRQHRIHPLRFLHAFAADIAQPIARDGREHIEYVPTQVATEYFRRVFRDEEGLPIDGIIYDSSRQPSGRAFVLFCENDQCFPPEGFAFNEQLVELAAVAHEQLPGDPEQGQ